MQERRHRRGLTRGVASAAQHARRQICGGRRRAGASDGRAGATGHRGRATTRGNGSWRQHGGQEQGDTDREDAGVATGTFAAVISCVDGRVQPPLSQWMRARSGVEYIDTITVPGPDLVLTRGVADVVAGLRQSLVISVTAHGTSVVAVAGHTDCAAFPATADEHRQAISRAVQVVASWGLPVHIVGLWLNTQWQVEMVADVPAPPRT